MSKKFRVVGAVQARLGSQRLPRKALLPIVGRPMVQHILERVAQAERIDQVVLATSDAAEDDELEALALGLGHAASRGPLEDIVGRLHRAAQETGADLLVRVWGDCPCVDPRVLDLALEQMGDDYDFFTCSPLLEGAGEGGRPKVDGTGRALPVGLDFEIYTRTTLERLESAAREPFFRLYPSDFLFRSHSDFRLGGLRYPRRYERYFLTVDYAEDLDLVRAIYAALYRPERPFELAELVAFLEETARLPVGDRGLARNIEYRERREQQQGRDPEPGDGTRGP